VRRAIRDSCIARRVVRWILDCARVIHRSIERLID